MAHKIRNAAPGVIRISGSALEIVQRVSDHTGWSAAKVVSELVPAGLAAIEERENVVASIRQVIEAAVAHHVVEEVANRNLYKTRNALAKAQKLAKQVAGGVA